MARSAYDPAKRALDIVGALLAFVVLMPVQAIVAVAVAAKLGRPVLFKQRRPGRDGSIFALVKFRTMLTVDEASGLMSDEQRLTRFGSFLRSTSLDELPSLINVIRGDMSIVGPRPLLVSYLDRYTAQQARRHEVRPGITGLAQVRGRNGIDWQTKFALDVEYVDNRSFMLDARILAETFATVLRREGIAAKGAATMEEFRGREGGAT